MFPRSTSKDVNSPPLVVWQKNIWYSVSLMSLTFFLAVFIIMSDLSNFEITLEHGRGGLIVFEICFGDNYPNTLFRDSEWSHSTLFRESLVLIMMSTLATSELFIHAFYSKGASCTVAPNPDEQVILRNLGTMTLLTVLQLYPHIECVRLEASGGFPWYNKRIVPFVKYMGDGDRGRILMHYHSH